MIDGFVEIGPDASAFGTAKNLMPYLNSYSPFGRFERLPHEPVDSKLWGDGYYGHVYDSRIATGFCPYGIGNEMSAGPLEDTANEGFLRIPFAKIPKTRVSGEAQLRELLARLAGVRPPGLKYFFRGQVAAYRLPRSSQALDALYGDAQAEEPSLLASASRMQNNVLDCFPAWCSHLRMILAHLDPRPLKESFGATVTYGFSRFALAIAQHYGLPTVGLDVTDDIGVAKFFALHRFTKDKHDRLISRCTRLGEACAKPVIYVFALHSSQMLIDATDDVLAGTSATRQVAQRSYFLPRSWGYSLNDAARWLVHAIYLDPLGDFAAVPSAAQMFPAPNQDPFGSELEKLAKYLDHFDSNDEVRKLLSNFYWVE